MRHIFLNTCAAVALVASACASEEWTMDFNAALQQAAKENKVLMVDFNGSDWCGPCKMLKSKVFDTAEFDTYAKDKFILVDIDMPRGDKLSAEQKKINQELGKKYKINGYPTVLVINKDGVVLGGHSGGTDQIERVTTNLDAALANAAAIDAAMAKADDAKGVDKAKAYMKAYELTPNAFKQYNTPIKELILANDPDDVCGLKAAEELKIERNKASQQAYMLVAKTPHSEHVEVISKELEKTDLDPLYKMMLKQNLISAKMLTCKTTKDLAKIKAEYKAYADQYPSEKDAIAMTLDNLAQIGDEAMLERIKKIADMYEAREKQAAAMKAAAEASQK